MKALILIIILSVTGKGNNNIFTKEASCTYWTNFLKLEVNVMGGIECHAEYGFPIIKLYPSSAVESYTFSTSEDQKKSLAQFIANLNDMNKAELNILIDLLKGCEENLNENKLSLEKYFDFYKAYKNQISSLPIETKKVVINLLE